jgi:sugar phosphate isomerase/epimerase
MKIGIMQGRLSPQLGDHVQNFPQSTWQTEFDLLTTLPVMPYYAPDASDIDWIVPLEGWEKNPLFHKPLREYPIHSICADSLIHPDFPSRQCLEDYFTPICSFAMLNGIDHITVPLLEHSSVMDKSKRKSFLSFISQFVTQRLPTLTLSFEFEADEDIIDEVLATHPSFRMTYDTGNFTGYFKDKTNHRKLITKYAKLIDNVHLKDRTFDCHSVEPGEGDTDFVEIFEALSEVGYDGHYTLQTTRGRASQEMVTISRHMDYFVKLMDITSQ